MWTWFNPIIGYNFMTSLCYVLALPYYTNEALTRPFKSTIQIKHIFRSAPLSPSSTDNITYSIWIWQHAVIPTITCVTRRHIFVLLGTSLYYASFMRKRLRTINLFIHVSNTQTIKERHIAHIEHCEVRSLSKSIHSWITFCAHCVFVCYSWQPQFKQRVRLVRTGPQISIIKTDRE